MYRLPVKITKVHPPFVLLDQLDTVILTGENFFDNSDTGLLYVRLTREMTNDDDTNLVHTVLLCTYNANDSTVSFTFPSNIYTDKDWIHLELTFDDVTWTSAIPNRISVAKQVQLTRTWPSHVYLGEVNTEIYL